MRALTLSIYLFVLKMRKKNRGASFSLNFRTGALVGGKRERKNSRFEIQPILWKTLISFV